MEKNELENTVYELLLEECELNDCMIKLEVENLSLIPSNVNLAGAEIELIGVENKEFILKNSIDKIREQYDFIIIDCPPSLNTVSYTHLLRLLYWMSRRLDWIPNRL